MGQPNPGSYRPGYDNNLTPYDISSQRGLGLGKTYSMLRGTETYGQTRMQYVNNLFLYDKLYKNASSPIKNSLLHDAFPNKLLK